MQRFFNKLFSKKIWIQKSGGQVQKQKRSLSQSVKAAPRSWWLTARLDRVWKKSK